MNLEQVLDAIRDRSTPGRDHLVDDLNDQLEAGALEPSSAREVVLALIDIAHNEGDPNVHESIMNLLSSYYLDGECQPEIEAYIINFGATFEPMSVVHLLSIVADSQLPNRREILAAYTGSENRAVREQAQTYLSDN